VEGGVRGLCYSDDGAVYRVVAAEFEQASAGAVGGYFKDPTGTTKQVGSDMRGAGENFTVSKDNMEQLKEQLQKSDQGSSTLREVQEPYRHDGDE